MMFKTTDMKIISTHIYTPKTLAIVIDLATGGTIMLKILAAVLQQNIESTFREYILKNFYMAGL